MSGFNKLLPATILGLGLAIGALSVASARLGPAVDTFSTAHTLDGTSVNTEIAVTFTSPMNIRSVESQFHLSPAVPGSFSWSGNELVYVPDRPLRYGTTYAVRIGAAALDVTGKHLFRAFNTRFVTQTPHLLYMGTGGEDQGRLVLASVSGRRSVVDNGGRVTDFSVSPDRSLVTYVREGGAGERPDEIWLLSLQDGSTQRVFRRPDWTITEPHLSPDKQYIVFLATNVWICPKYYQCFRDKAGPLIYLLDLHTRQVKPYRSTSDVPITNFIDFSPKGQLAYTDLGSALTLANPDGSHIFHVPNLGNSPLYSGFDPAGDKAAFVGQTPDSTGGDILVYQGGKYLDVSRGIYDSASPAFSASGNQIAYSAYRGEVGIEPVYGINVYDFRGRKTRKVTAERTWSDWSPQWSLDGKYLAFVRSQPLEAMYMGSGLIWVATSDGRRAWPLGEMGKNPLWVS